jgi:hypothetical protein
MLTMRLQCQQERGISPHSLDAQFEEGGYFDARSGCPDVWANLRAWG